MSTVCSPRSTPVATQKQYARRNLLRDILTSPRSTPEDETALAAELKRLDEITAGPRCTPEATSERIDELELLPLCPPRFGTLSIYDLETKKTCSAVDAQTIAITTLPCVSGSGELRGLDISSEAVGRAMGPGAGEDGEVTSEVKVSLVWTASSQCSRIRGHVNLRVQSGLYQNKISTPTSRSGQTPEPPHFSAVVWVENKTSLSAFPTKVQEALLRDDLISKVRTLNFDYSCNPTDTEWVDRSLQPLRQPCLYGSAFDNNAPSVPASIKIGQLCEIEGTWADRNVIFKLTDATLEAEYDHAPNASELRAALDTAFGQEGHPIKVKSKIMMTGSLKRFKGTSGDASEMAC